MTYFIKKGDVFTVSSDREFDIRDMLPPGNYSVEKVPMIEEYYLKIAPPFELPDQLYGNVKSRTKRIINTFLERDQSTGVLLSGLKGSGKSLLAKNIAEMLINGNVPVLMVNREYCGPAFNRFIANIEQPCMVLFDEFEKIYSSEAQEQLLSLLDGVYTTKKLFMLTINDQHKIDRNMKNRPGRIFYAIDYSGLSPDDVKEFCKDRLENHDHIPNIVSILGIFKDFNFDMLQSLVEEMNRYNESPQEALAMLNISSQMGYEDYMVTVIRDDMIVTSFEWGGNIFDTAYISFTDPDKLTDECEGGHHAFYLQENQCKKMNVDIGEYTFEEDDYIIKFRKLTQKWNRWNLVN